MTARFPVRQDEIMKIGAYRKLVGLTLAELALKIGVTEGSMSRYENGERIPTREILQRIKAVTDGAVQPNDFYDSTPDAKEAANGPEKARDGQAA